MLKEAGYAMTKLEFLETRLCGESDTSLLVLSRGEEENTD